MFNIDVHVHLAGVDDVRQIKSMLAQILKIGESMNQAIQDAAAKSKAQTVALLAALATIGTAVAGVSGDVQALKKQIEDAAGSETLSEEDKAALVAIGTSGDDVVAKLEAVAASMKALDELTPAVDGGEVQPVNPA